MLRTALSLSLVTGTPFCMTHIRAGRARPGLLRQHLTAVRAAAAIGEARVEGDALNAQEISFWPGAVRGGELEVEIGSAGSATLVAQTLLPALLRARGPARVRIGGGTHNPLAPPCEHLAEVFVPLLRRLGGDVGVSLLRHGFAPAGGGRLELETQPSRLGRLELLSRGAVQSVSARILFAQLPFGVAQREKAALVQLGWDEASIRIEEVKSNGPGNIVLATARSEHITEGFVQFGERGVRAEAVAAALAKQVGAHLESQAPVGPHLADQLLLPLALGEGGIFRTMVPTLHARTQAEVIAAFLGPRVTFELEPGDACTVTVRDRTA